MAAILLPAGPSATLHAAGLARLQRKFDVERGLPFSEVNSITQDSRGFLWITAGGGLFRYDGTEVRRWGMEGARRFVKSVAAGPQGAVLVRTGTGDAGDLCQVEGDTIRPIAGPHGATMVISGLPVWDAAGNLWVISDDLRVWSRPPSGPWREFPRSSLSAEEPRLLEGAENGDPVVVTDEAVWRLGADLRARRLCTIGSVQKVLVRADGSIVALSFRADGSEVLESVDVTWRRLFQFGSRPIDMIQQGRTLWVAYDTGLVALRPGEAPEILGPADGCPGGGPLFVDDEGSLWIASFRGLLQYPAPDTVALLGGQGTRRLVSGPEGIWVDSWTSLSLLRREHGSIRVEPPIPGTGTSALCAATDGATWAGYAGRFLERRRGRFLSYPRPGLTYVASCSPGRGGRVWLVTNLGLMLAGEAGGPRRMAGPPNAESEGTLVTVLEDGAERLWVTANEEICHAQAAEVASSRPARWSCTTAAGAGTVTSLAEVAPGSLWAATSEGGVYRRSERRSQTDRWEPIPGSRALPTPLVRRLRPSPSGGAWVVSYGTILRAVERPRSEDGWEIAERPSSWHGLMISDAEDILEEPSGDLWITTLAGVVHLPAQVRRQAPPIPRVALVGALLDGKPLDWQRGITLPFRQNRIELKFAALSFRDTALLRYQVRLRPDAPWRAASSRPSFQFVDLPPGRYEPQVRASLDGHRWSKTPAGLSLTVLPPFWRTWWFAVAAGFLLVALGVAVHRARVAHLVAVERVRTRIATDLHDDIGASLSRTAILAEVVRREIAPTSAGAAERLDRIARSAREVVDGMADVVWSLDPSRDDFGDLLARVRAFSSEVLPPSGVTATVEGPRDVTALTTRLGAEARRQVYLAVKEAVSNVARHAQAKNASIQLGVEGGWIEAVVSDDGVGFSSGPPAGARLFGGNGLRNIHARVARCHGTLSIESEPGRGTRIHLRIPVHDGARA